MAKVNAAAIKLIKNNFSSHLDAALTEHVRATESWAGKVRLFFAVVFAVATGWTWDRPDNTKLICLALTIGWLVVMLVVRSRQGSGATTSQVTANTLIDVTVVNLGLLALVRQGQLGLFSELGTGLFLCYFPLLAVAANRYRIGLVLTAGGYAILFYLGLTLYAGHAPWFRLAILGMMMLVFVAGSRRPKSLVIEVAENELDAAYQLGLQQSEQEMAAQAHQLLLPPPIVELSRLLCTAKHGAGARTGGDYYQVFDTPRGPLVIVGDLGGEGFEALKQVNELHQQVAREVAGGLGLVGILANLNTWLVEKYGGRRPFTCVIAEWEGEQMRYVNAGHPPMIQMSKPQGAQAVNQHTLPATSGPLGLAADAEFVESTVSFPSRDLMIVYTDGLFSKLASDREKGIAEIEAMAGRFSGGEVNTLCHRIFDCAQPGYDRIADDATIVVVRRQPE
jgi:hypothetical protein